MISAESSLSKHLKVDSAWGSVIYTIGVLESRIGGSTLWILPGVRVTGGRTTAIPGLISPRLVALVQLRFKRSDLGNGLGRLLAFFAFFTRFL